MEIEKEKIEIIEKEKYLIFMDNKNNKTRISLNKLIGITDSKRKRQ